KMKVLEGILGALIVEQQFSHLRCSFQLHLNQSARPNPIRLLIQMSYRSQYLFPLQNDELYDQFSNTPDLPLLINSSRFECQSSCDFPDDWESYPSQKVSLSTIFQ